MCRFAEQYDDCMRPLERRVFGKRRRALLPLAVGDVLEIGGGTGVNLALYSNAGSLVFTDPEPAMLAIARTKPVVPNLPIRFETAPAEHLPFPNASFDTVVSTLVLCTVDDPAQTLAEIRRVLRPGGKALFLEHIRPPHLLGLLADLLTPLQKRLAAGCRLNRRTREAVAAAGFSLERNDREIWGIVATMVGRVWES
jgi:ubiquinone/menaquinone biosynthesis C-methylase UbiE